MRSRPSPKSFALVCLLAMSACGKPTSGPLLATIPQLDEVPAFTPLAMREVPAAVRDELILSLEPGSITPDVEDYVNSPGAEAGEAGARPSVIISVPLEATQAARRAAELRAQGMAPTSAIGSQEVGASALESFQTDGYYNQAEQQVETALIRRGFDVLDRARFEATLRDLRDRADVTGRCWRDICDIAEAAGTDAARRRLEAQLEAGELSLEEYQMTVDELNRRAERSSPGQRRTEDEMVDIAEVIRAAQSGSETSDYLLQISVVKVEPSFDRQFNIDRFPETRDFLARNPGLQLGSGPGRLPPAVPSKWYRAEFNAKLMSIQTGSIVWLGNHVLSSQHAEEMTITIDVERRVANAEAVTAAIRDYNLRGDQLQNDASRTRSQLQALYSQAQSPQQFESEEAMLAWEDQTRTRIATLERSFRDLRQQLVNHAANRPAAFTEDFEYEYSVSEAVVTPNLTEVDANDRRAQERLDEHRNNLIRAVTRSLIETIEVIR